MGFLFCKMLPHSTRHVSQKSAGVQISLSERPATLRAEALAIAALHVPGDALATERVLAGQHHWIGEIAQTHRALDLPRQGIHFKQGAISLKKKLSFLRPCIKLSLLI